MNYNLFVVTRQCYYYSSENIVEIAQGGRDYSGSDALSGKYPGEFEEFIDLREAVEVAIDICRKWRKDGKKTAKVALGFNHGMCMEFEPTTFKDIIKTAKKWHDKQEKCPCCGEVIDPDNHYTLSYEYDMGDKYCSEYCCEKEIEYQIRSNGELGTD